MADNTKKRIFLASPHMSAEGYELQFVKHAFDTNWVAPLGENVDMFEKELCDFVGAKDGAALSAGTAAIHLALKAAGVGEGDTVLCPSLTFSATANPIVYQNATPVFVDSDEATWNMSPLALEKALDKYPQAKAVMCVHLYGLAADMNKIVALCRERNVALIEDAAESLGTTYGDKYTGTFGDYGIFSFNGNKIITTSGGGMLVANFDNEEKAQERIKKVRFWATQSRDPARHYQHSELGFNYRMSNIVAGIGRGQLKVLPERIEQKRHIYEFYSNAFKGVDDISLMPRDVNSRSNCWLSCIRLSGKVTPLDVMQHLEKENIESRPIWKPMHLQPFYAENDYIDNGGVGEKIFNSGVCLPSDTKLTDDELQMICDKVKELF